MNILIIDDDAEFLRPIFACFPANIRWAATRPVMENELSTSEFDAIMMDGSLVGWGRQSGVPGHGPDVVRELRNRGVTTKIVMFSGSDEWNKEGLTVGANSTWNKKRCYEPNWQETLLATLG